MQGAALRHRQEDQRARDEAAAELDADVEARLSALHATGQPASHAELPEAHSDHERGRESHAELREHQFPCPVASALAPGQSQGQAEHSAAEIRPD